MIESVSKYYPESKIVYYDVGLTVKQIAEVANMSNIDYRRFNFSAYSAHMFNLKIYAFKEMFKEYKTFYYFDASVRIKKRKLEHLLGTQKRDVPPLILYNQAVHSVYATVHPGMLEYFPLPKSILIVPELESNTIFFSDSPFMRQVFKWWILCTMTEECIAPFGSKVKCEIGKYKDTYHTYIDCHRYDQAFYNIMLLSHMFGKDRGALKYKYVNKEWTHIDHELVDSFNGKRMQYQRYYASVVNIDRWS